MASLLSVGPVAVTAMGLDMPGFLKGTKSFIEACTLVYGGMLGLEAALSEFVRMQVAEGVRLRCGEPRYVDWKKEGELAEVMAVATGAQNSLPESHLSVRQCASTTKGLGLFTSHPISMGTHILQYTGVAVDGATFSQQQMSSEYAISACSAAGDQFYIDGAALDSGLGRFMNHAKLGELENNCACIRGAYRRDSPRAPPELHIFARRDIQAGEELQWDYGAEYWAEREELQTNANSAEEALRLRGGARVLSQAATLAYCATALQRRRMHSPLCVSSGLTFESGDARLVSIQKPLGILLEPLDEADRGVVVVEVGPETNAARAGVRSGDRLLAVNNLDVSLAPLSAVMQAISATPGRVVNLRFRSTGTELCK